MISVAKFEIKNNKEYGVFEVECDEPCICPECECPLEYRDKVLRGQLKEGGGRDWYLINRMKCTNEDCGKLHRQLTVFMVAFKQYTAQAIEDVLDGVVSEEDGMDYPCDGTMRHWRWWFLFNAENMEGQARSALHSCGGHTGSLDAATFSTEALRSEFSPGWLGILCRVVYNAGGRISPG